MKFLFEGEEEVRQPESRAVRRARIRELLGSISCCRRTARMWRADLPSVIVGEPRHLRARSHRDGPRQGPALRSPRRRGRQPDPGAGRAARRPARRRRHASRSRASMTASTPRRRRASRTRSRGLPFDEARLFDAIGALRRRGRGRLHAAAAQLAAADAGVQRHLRRLHRAARRRSSRPRPAPRSPAGSCRARTRTRIASS